MTFGACSIFNSLFCVLDLALKIFTNPLGQCNLLSRCSDATIKIFFFKTHKRNERLIWNAKLALNCCSKARASVLKAIHLKAYLRFFVCLLTLGQKGLSHLSSLGKPRNFSLQRKQVDPNLFVALGTYVRVI